MSDVQTIWKQACAQLQLELSPAVFNTWIVSNPLTNLEALDENRLVGTITSPTAFHSANLQKNLAPLVAAVLTRIIGRPVELVFQVGNPVMPQMNGSLSSVNTIGQVLNNPNNMARSNLGTNNFNPNAMGDINAMNAGPMAAQNGGFAPQTGVSASPQAMSQPSMSPAPAPNSTASPRVEDLFSPAALQANAVDRAAVTARQVGLRADYTFSTFAVSTTNEMAHAAASAVSNSPGGAYNPLFLYGGVGVGKTHLMHAIGNNIVHNHPEVKMLYVTGEEFTNEIVSAIQTKKAFRFKEKYRNIQVLLIDDIQFIAGKNAVQEEFFHTFNALTKQASQIVLTSDRPPHEINLLEDRLRSRFEAGLMIDIQSPSFELRTAILLIKAAAINLNIPMDLAQVIASKVDSARKIEGIITSLRSEVELKRRDITAELVDEILHLEGDKRRPKLKVTPADVLRTVANHYHIKQTALKGQRRVASLVHARHVAMFLLKEELNLPLTEIGRWFSNRDHTSALHAIRKMEKQMQSDEMLQRDVSALRMSLSAVSR